MRAELKALRSYALPRYPTWALVESEPALLARAIPRRWEGRAKVAAALAAAVFGFSGSALAAEGAPPATGEPPKDPPTTPIAVPTATPGIDIGFEACIAIAPPVFLSEAEAREVIRAELALAGLADLAADQERVPEIVTHRRRVTRYDRDLDRDVQVLEDTTDPPTDLLLDGWDAAKRIGYEYVSPEDYAELSGTDFLGWYESEVTYQEVEAHLKRRLAAAETKAPEAVTAPDATKAPDVAKAPDATKVSDVAKAPDATKVPDATKPAATGKPAPAAPAGNDAAEAQLLRRTVGVFHAPMVASESWGTPKPEEFAQAKEKLRGQVRDFAAWLKAQGLLQ